ncbi:molybdopterin-dependent oxidoreductase [Conyzicola nivalis]
MESLQTVLNGLRRSLAAPSRTPRMAVVIGRLLGIAFLLCFGTGLFSHFLQDPLPWMVFPTRPVFLYQVTQGIHITAGILCFPLLFAKLYIVFPELFQTPAVRSFPHFLERASIAVFVSTSIVQIVTGLLNTYQWYALFPFPFRQTHYALSFVIVGSLAIHIAVKLDVIAKHWRSSAGAVAEPVEAPGISARSITGLATRPTLTSSHTRNAVIRVEGVTGRLFAWIDSTPRPELRTSRRGFLAIVGVASAAVVALTAGQSFRLLDGANLFGARKQGVGPNSLPVNRTATAAKVRDAASDPAWALTVSNGATSATFTRAELLALPQREVELPIACVEGWSQTATWRGVRLGDLVDSVGGRGGSSIRATSLEQNSSYAIMHMGPEYVRDDLTLVALELNGETLDLDHGYPARMIAPGRPGVLQTKWLSTLEVL